MNCKKCQKLYLLSLDGQLSPRQKRYMDEHLRLCPDCQKQVQDIRNLQLKLEKAEKIFPSEQVLQNIRDEAYQNLPSLEKQPFFSFPKVQVVLPRLAYALMVIGALFFALKIIIPRWQTSPIETIQIAKTTGDVTGRDFEYLDRYFNDKYVNKTEKDIGEAFYVIDETKQLLALASKKYDLSFYVQPESLNDNLRALERRVKKINTRIQ